jgi:hypothetical protein
MFLPLIILLVIIFTLLGTIIWNTKNTTSSTSIIACIGEDVKVAYPLAGDPQTSYEFGQSVAISGDTLVVGAYGSTTTGTDDANYSGAVYVYRDGNYTLRPDKVAYPSTGDPQPGYQFGESVAISGDTLVVGASGSTTTGTDTANSSGAVYVYKNGNYTLRPDKVAYPSTGDPQGFYLFGGSVDISGDTLVVGASGSTTTGTGTANSSGAVYVYKNGNYTLPPDKVAYPSTGDPQGFYRFGWSVAISGDTLVVGAYGSTTTGTGTYNYSGAVYVYKNGNYTLRPDKVAYPSTGDPQPGYEFGTAIAISGDTLVVSAPGSTTTGTGTANRSGAVYVYRDGNYTLPPIEVGYVGDYIPLADYEFGYAVCTNGEAVGVGANGQPADGTSEANYAGAAYMYPCIGES